MQFMAGDIVRIVDKVEKEIGWNSNGDMDYTMDMTGIVVDIGEAENNSLVRFSDGETWRYDWECLELEIDIARINQFEANNVLSR